MTTDTDETRIADLLQQWETLHDQGSDVSAEELAQDRPELIPELNRRIKKLRATAWLNEPLEQEDERQTPHDFGLPDCLGRYQLESLLGSGGFGQVWKAFDPELNRSVAVKIPHPDRIEHNGDAQPFVEEARRVAQLRHPGIVPVHDVGQQDGIVYIVSEFVEGGNLADLIDDGKVDADKACKIIAKVAEALHHAHGRGYIHRDLKPANILLDSDGHPLIADFGIATAVDVDDTSLFGSLAYMPPEQLSGERVDSRSDIYSLSVVLFQMLTGDLPRQASSPSELKKSFESQPVVLIPPAIPSRLRHVCQRCLSVERENRYTTAKELADDLRSPKPTAWGLYGVSIATVLILIAALSGYLTSDLWRDRKSNPPPHSPVASGPKKTHASKATTAGFSTLTKHAGPVVEVALIPSLSLVASAGKDGSVRLTKMDGVVVSEIEHDSAVTMLAAIGEDRLATGDSEGVIRLWDVRENPPKELNKLTALSAAVTGIATNLNGDYLVASSADGKIVLYVMSFDPPRATPLHEAVGDVLVIQFTDTTNFAIGMSTNDEKPALFRAYYLNPEKGELHPTSNTPMVQTHHTTAMAVSDEGKFILSACTGSGIPTWRWEGKNFLAEGVFAEHSSPVTAVTVVPKGNRAVSADKHGIVRLWNLADQIEDSRVDAGSPVTSLWSSREFVVVGTASGEVRIWKLPPLKL